MSRLRKITFSCLKESNELIYEDALNTSHNTSADIPSKHDQERSLSAKTTPKLVHGPPTRVQPSSSFGPSNVVFITNLTRPFTVNQLKEMLSKYGTFKIKPGAKQEPYFWIDAVKSHCYVAYETEAEAEKAIGALNNVTWPASNPKKLNVGYSSMDEIMSVIENDGAAPAKIRPTTNGDDRVKSDRKVSSSSSTYLKPHEI